MRVGVPPFTAHFLHIFVVGLLSFHLSEWSVEFDTEWHLYAEWKSYVDHTGVTPMTLW